MPLPFVGKTTTIRMDDNETQPDFEIPAMDTTIGTSPSGSAWRRNPIPACNCDLGEEGSCWGGGNKGYGGGNFTKAYEIDPQAPTKTPRCPTGVQFPPAWPEGYGYGSEYHAPGSEKPVDPHSPFLNQGLAGPPRCHALRRHVAMETLATLSIPQCGDVFVWRGWPCAR